MNVHTLNMNILRTTGSNADGTHFIIETKYTWFMQVEITKRRMGSRKKVFDRVYVDTELIIM